MADPKESAIRAGALTPNRRSVVTFDIDEDVLTEKFILYERSGSAMQPTAVNNCIRLKSGAWILEPLQSRDYGHELEAARDYQLRLADFSADPIVVEVPTQRIPSELTGIAPDPSVSTSGDYFFTARVAAGATWANSLLGAPALPTFGDPAYPLQHLMRSLANHDANTSYLIRIKSGQGALQTASEFFGFSFGGAIYGPGQMPHSGFGLFFLLLSGDGQARLYEWIDEAWAEVHRWRAFAPGQFAGNGLVLRIIPHWSHFLEISTAITREPAPRLIELLSQISAMAVLAAQGDAGGSTIVHETTNRGEQASGPGPGFLWPISGTGPISVWARQDMRIQWAISRLGFPASGAIEDGPFQVPYGFGDAHLIRVASLRGYNFFTATDVRTTNLEAVIEEYDGTALTADTETITWKDEEIDLDGWVLNGDDNRLRTVHTLTCDEAEGSRYHTPVLLGYAVARNAHIDRFEPGEKIAGTVTGVSITGAALDLDHESASVQVEDLKNELSFLRARAKASVRIETHFDDAGAESAETAVLMEGVTSRVVSSLKGKLGMVYPSDQWRNLDVQCTGKWDRLSHRFFYDLIDFSNAADSFEEQTGNRILTWKISEIVRFCLSIMGVVEARMDVADLPLRIFTGPGQRAQGTTQTTPGTSILEYLQSIVAQYLGYLIWYDANAGPKADAPAGTLPGMWRLVAPPDGTSTPVWNFVTTGPAAGAKLRHRSAAYGANTSPILGPEPLRSYVIPPEANVLSVVGGADPRTGQRVQRTLYNPTSWNSPTSSIADDEDLDFLGTIVEASYVDVSVGDQGHANFLARRLFEQACRGLKIVEATSELVLIDAAAIEPDFYTVHPKRPLRFWDQVNVDGTRYVVLSCNPAYSNDMFQTQHMELALYRGGTFFQ